MSLAAGERKKEMVQIDNNEGIHITSHDFHPVHELVQLEYTHTRLTALCPGLPGWTGTRKGKPIWILLKQETMSCSGISWAVCKSAPRSRQIAMPAPHHSFFYRPVAFPAAQPVVKVDRRIRWHYTTTILRLRIGARLTRYRNCKFRNFARTISRHADGIGRYSVPPSAGGPLLPLRPTNSVKALKA